MKGKISNNQIAVANFAVPLSVIYENRDKFVVRDVRPAFHYDEERKATNIVECIKYTLADPDSFDTFTVKVNQTVPAISEQELAAAQDTVWATLPMAETFIKPYRLEYGQLKVSITAPFIELLDSEDV